MAWCLSTGTNLPYLYLIFGVCGTWYLTLWEENRLRKLILRIIFEFTREKVNRRLEINE
jgi:hypothetical protein